MTDILLRGILEEGFSLIDRTTDQPFSETNFAELGQAIDAALARGATTIWQER